MTDSIRLELDGHSATVRVGDSVVMTDAGLLPAPPASAEDGR